MSVKIYIAAGLVALSCCGYSQSSTSESVALVLGNNGQSRNELAVEAGKLLEGREHGYMALPKTLAGVSVGGKMSSVLKDFGPPDADGKTDSVGFFAAGWPGTEYSVYLSERVAFIGTGKIEQIIVGFDDSIGDSVALSGNSDSGVVFTGKGKKGTLFSVADVSSGGGQIVTRDNCRNIESAYGGRLHIVEVEIDNRSGMDVFSWLCLCKAVTVGGKVLTPVSISESLDYRIPTDVRDAFLFKTVAAGEKKTIAIAFPAPAGSGSLKQIDLKNGFLYDASCFASTDRGE